ncbi:hypothetical protein TSUD_290430 [Trifolium subterraneum]|uniref:Uncharacterized protein n=1 Tax=Trifolium subterraneum TaxID=3900 RepID=A0A2Z6M4A5_TRISU|nr:hypothetical protein TSUD_290430 [Trifolium subterraneum]
MINGLIVLVGERGGLLSRVAIGKALLKNAPILIATSALDTVTERFVGETLNRLTKDRTTLVILSSVQNALQIALCSNGRNTKVKLHSFILHVYCPEMLGTWSIRLSCEYYPSAFPSWELLSNNPSFHPAIAMPPSSAVLETTCNCSSSNRTSSSAVEASNWESG